MLKSPQLAICVALEQVDSAINAALLSNSEPRPRILAACRKLGEFTQSKEFADLPSELRNRIRSLGERGESVTSESDIAPVTQELLGLHAALLRSKLDPD